MKLWMAAAAAGLMFAGSTAIAQDGDDYAFDLYNASSVPVTQLNTRMPSGAWSSNWLRTQVRPGESRPMRFTGGDDRCEIVTRVTFADDSYFEDTVDYCNKETLTVSNRTMSIE
ncbi:MAG TPA: hypothetical protein VGB54_03175 [Allosphingosinicella sp.]